MNFKQKRLALRIESELTPNGVFIKEKDLLNNFETIIPYENISDQVIRSFQISKLFIFICVFLFTVMAFNIYDFLYQDENTPRVAATSRDVVNSTICFVIAAIGTWMRSVRYVGLVCVGGSLMFLDVKGKQNPDNYLKEVIRQRDLYFQEHYEHRQKTEVLIEESIGAAIH